MNEKIKKLWRADLISGEYIQGYDALHSNGKFCCLGVLCDLYAKEKGVNWTSIPNDFNRLSIHGAKLILPDEVVEWAELENESPMVGGYHLTEMNDEEGKSFKQIADLIEANL